VKSLTFYATNDKVLGVKSTYSYNKNQFETCENDHLKNVI